MMKMIYFNSVFSFFEVVEIELKWIRLRIGNELVVVVVRACVCKVVALVAKEHLNKRKAKEEKKRKRENININY